LLDLSDAFLLTIEFARHFRLFIPSMRPKSALAAQTTSTSHRTHKHISLSRSASITRHRRIQITRFLSIWQQNAVSLARRATFRSIIRLLSVIQCFPSCLTLTILSVAWNQDTFRDYLTNYSKFIHICMPLVKI
jgi:hypothetical protein